MISRERSAGRIETNEASVIHSGPSSHPRFERSGTPRLLGLNLPLDESKPSLRCTRELVTCGSAEVHGKDGRNSKRRHGGDIVSRDSFTGKAGVREGLRLLHSPPEGIRRKKGLESRIASAEVPSALGSELGGKRTRRAPAIYKESGGDHAVKGVRASQPSTGQTEENERRSERIKERRKLVRKKILEESQSIHWEVQFDSGRHKKSSSRRQRGNRGKSRVQTKKHVKEPWPVDREKGMSQLSSQEGHEDQREGPIWTRRLRDRGKKRVLDFCAEVEVEAHAPDARVVKQKVEKADEINEDDQDQLADELDVLFLRSWSRKHRRNLRTRARYQNLKLESQAVITSDSGGVEGSAPDAVDLPSSSREKQVGASPENAMVTRSKLKNWSLSSRINGWGVSSNEPDICSLEEAASKVVHEKVRGVHDLLSLEGQHSEAVHVVSEEQIHLVLDLCIEPGKEEDSDDGAQLIVNTATSPPRDNVYRSMGSSVGGINLLCSAGPPLQARAVWSSEGAEIASSSVLHEEGSGCDSNAVNASVPENPENQNCNGIAEGKVIDCRESRVCSDVLEKKMVLFGEYIIGRVDGKEVLEPEFAKDKVFQVGVQGKGNQLVDEEVLRIKEPPVAIDTVTDKVAEGEDVLVCTEMHKGAVVEVREKRMSIELANQDVFKAPEHPCSDAPEKMLEISEDGACNEISPRRVLEVREHSLCDEIAEEHVLDVQEHRICSEMEKVEVLELGKHRVWTETVEDEAAEGPESEVHHNAVLPAVGGVLVGLELSESLCVETNNERSSGSSDHRTSGGNAGQVRQRSLEDSTGNSVDDFDVLAKYCSTVLKTKKCVSHTYAKDTMDGTIISEAGPSKYDNLGMGERQDETVDPRGNKASTSSGRSEPSGENGSADQEESASTRLQSLLDVVRKEVNATPELAKLWDCVEPEVLHGASQNIQKTIDFLSQDGLGKERGAKHGHHDARKGVVNGGLKCGLCGGTSDGKWASELRFVRKTKARDGAQYASPKLVKYAVKESIKMQVKKGWLGRLLGPLSERVGVAGAWVHEECAVWSPEVYFAGVGRLKNVKAAIRRGRLLKCSHCGQPGATIGCRVDRCPQNYHLPCAHFDGCSFDHKKYLVACSEHLHLFPSRYRRFLENGVEVKTSGPNDHKDTSKLHRGNFRRMMIERRAAASTCRLKDLEEEEKCMEKSGEDEEFVRRERKRLQRDLARIVPTKLGGRKSSNHENTIPDGWNSVAGLHDVVECLKEMVILPLLYPGAFDKLGILPPRGVLLHGHSGTGKTLVVRALAGACARGPQQISYFARKGADCLGKYVGDAERQLRLLFHVAEQHQPSIIFFDEIDGLAPSRSRDGQDQTHSSVVSTLLALMDGLSSRGSVIVIGATNRPDALDPALRRPGRFDREIYFPLPSAADRTAILSLHTRSWVPRPSREVLSAVAKATRGFAGADLRALCGEVAMKALKRVAPIHQLMESAEARETDEGLPRLPQIEVKAGDWAGALKEAPPPCSMRMTSAALSYIPGSPLPWYLVPSLLPILVEVLLQLHADGRSSMPPALTGAVSSIALELESFAPCSKVRKPSSPFRWMSLLQLGGHKLLKSAEEALTSAGVVSRREGSMNSGHVEPFGRDKHIVGDLHDSSCSPEPFADVDWRGGKFRVLLSGRGKRGQRLVAASLITGFEGFSETRMLNLPTMLYEGDGDVIQGLNRILGAGTGSAPSLLFMPEIESWAVAKEEVDDESLTDSISPCIIDPSNLVCNTSSQEVSRGNVPQHGQRQGNPVATASSAWSVFLQHITFLSSDTSIMFLATSHLCLEELPVKVVEFFTSNSNKCKYKHVVSKNQPVPCALVQFPPLTEEVAVIEHSSLEISRSIAGRLLRHLRYMEESPRVSEAHASLLSKLADSRLCTEEMVSSSTKASPEDGLYIGNDPRTPSFNLKTPIEQLPLLGISSVPERHPGVLDSWSSDQRTLQTAISQLSHQILHQPHFSDLRRITARIKAGPCFNASPIEQRVLSDTNRHRSWSSLRDPNVLEEKFERRDEKSASLSYGLVAVGLKGKNGLYASGTQLACEIRTVLKLFRDRVKAKIESGREKSMYVPLLSKAAGLEDIVSSWLYQIQRLEVAAKVFPLSGLKSGAASLAGTWFVSHSGESETRNASTLCPHNALEETETVSKDFEQSGDMVPDIEQRSAGLLQPKDQNRGFSIQDTVQSSCTRLARQPSCEIVGEAKTFIRELNAGALSQFAADDQDNSRVFSAKPLSIEGNNSKERSQRDNCVDSPKTSGEVHLQTPTANSLKSQETSTTRDAEGPIAAQSEDGAITGSIRGPTVAVSEDGCNTRSTDARSLNARSSEHRTNFEGDNDPVAVNLDDTKHVLFQRTQTGTPLRRHFSVNPESLFPLQDAVRRMILLAWKKHLSKSVELLYEVIASCAASIRVVSDDLIREVEWANGCLEGWDCPRRLHTSEIVGQLHTEFCLCPVIKVVQELTPESCGLTFD